MANPNIVNVSTIKGENAFAALTVSYATIVSNSASSGKIYKINSIIVANKDGSTAADLNIRFFDAATSTNVMIASTVSVPADATLVVVDKNSSFYLKEDQLIEASAGANGDLDIIVSYEDIS